MKINLDSGITYALSHKGETYSSLQKAIMADETLLTSRQLMKIIQHKQAPTNEQMSAINLYLKNEDWRELYVFENSDLLIQLVQSTLKRALDNFVLNGKLVFHLTTKTSYRTICSYFFTKLLARKGKINLDLQFSRKTLRRNDIKDITIDKILNLINNKDWKYLRLEIINRMPSKYSEANYHHSFRKALLLVLFGYI